MLHRIITWQLLSGFNPLANSPRTGPFQLYLNPSYICSSKLENSTTYIYILLHQCVYIYTHLSKLFFPNCPCVNSPTVVLHGEPIHFSTSWWVLELLAEISTQLKQYIWGLNDLKTYLQNQNDLKYSKTLDGSEIPANHHLRLVVLHIPKSTPHPNTQDFPQGWWEDRNRTPR